MHPATTQSDIQRLQNRVMTLATDRHYFEQHITELEAVIAKLRAELAATLLPYQGHTALLVNGVPTIFLGTGEVYEMVERDEYSATETTFGKREFRKLPSVPGSLAARIDAVAPALCEMGVLGDAMEGAA